MRASGRSATEARVGGCSIGFVIQVKALFARFALEPEPPVSRSASGDRAVADHLFAIGEIFDIILLVAGVAAIGYSIFTGMDHLYLFATGAYNARSLPALDAAADHFAKAVGILGIQAVLAVLFRGRPYGRREPAGPPPPPTPGFRYTPTLTWTKKLAAGQGETSFWWRYITSRCIAGSRLSST